MGLLQNSPNEKNEIDFPERGCLSHFLLYAEPSAHIYHRTRFFLYLPYKKILCFCVLSQSMSHYIDFIFSSTVKYFV